MNPTSRWQTKSAVGQQLEITGRSRTIYKEKDLTDTFARLSAQSILSEILNASDRQKKLNEALDGLRKDIKDLSSEKKEELKKCGFLENVGELTYPRVAEVVRGFFAETKINASEEEMAITANNYLYTRWGMKNCGHARLPEDTLNKLQINEEQVASLSCMDYALASLDGELAGKFRKKIFIREQLLDRFLTTEGWCNIEVPQQGDFVVYYNDYSKKICHLGVYTENDTVRSKMGINNPDIFEHQPFDVMGTYGNCLYFMRKSS